ncbi:tetratricopeptide repeat protein [Spirochaetota bacterium]
MTENESAELPGNIVFIKIPETMARLIGSFEVDPSILIPVELGAKGEDLSSFGWEMILAGMLRLLAFLPEHKDADYYRRFVQAVKPDIFTELSETAIVNAHNKEYGIAEEIFMALSGLAPDAPEPLLNLAILYEDKADSMEKTGQDDKAEELDSKAFDLYKKLFSMEPSYPDAYFNAAFFYLKKHSYEQALRCLEKYVELGEDDKKLAKARELAGTLKTRASADSVFKEAYDFIKMGREEESINRIKEFLAYNKDVWNGWFLLGWASRRLGRWEDGRKAFLEAIKLGGDGVDTLNELAICEMELNLLPESKKHLEKALHKEPENIKIISNLGVIAKKLGRLEEAMGFFRTVLEIEPNDHLAKAQIDELEKERN